MIRTLTFISATVPLTKTFTRTEDGRIDVEPYPHVREVSSQTVRVDNIEEMAEALQIMAASNAALLKGSLTRDIAGESRSGLTDTAADTHYVVLDYDSDQGFESPHELLAAIDPVLADTDYIFQHSASAGVTKHAGVRGHIFVLLEEPTAPSTIKAWTTKLNFSVETFREQITLDKAETGLKWPLDISVNDNSKLIYIAAPLCRGIEDQLAGKRWKLVKGSSRTFSLKGVQVSAAQNQQARQDLIAALRDARGLPAKKFRYSTTAHGELIENPDACTVTQHKQCAKYHRFNLNGGDSWAYWAFVDDPTYIYDYKSDTVARAADLIPAWWQQYLQQRAQEADGMAGTRVYGFRSTKTGAYMNIHVDPAKDVIVKVVPARSKDQVQDYFLQNGHPRPRSIDAWDVEFNPTTFVQYDVSKKWMNTFRPTPLLLTQKEKAGEWPTIHKVLRHICVDEPTYEHFINWLAFIFQRREKTKTAWIFHGAEGTGKGVMFNSILSPIFGSDYCRAITEVDLAKGYNGYMRDSLFIMIDEGLTTSQRKQNKLEGRLRNLITEDWLQIEEKYETGAKVKNYSNFILATNENLAVALGSTDRRYNVAPIQTNPIKLYDEFDNIPHELEDFAAYLRDFAVDEKAAQVNLNNEAHSELVDLGRTHTDRFYHALLRGDLTPFLDRYYAQRIPVELSIQHLEFQKIVDRMRVAAKSGCTFKLDLQDMLVLYNHLARDAKNAINDVKLGLLNKHHGIKSKRGKRPVADKKQAGKGSAFWTYVEVQFDWNEEWDDLSVENRPEPESVYLEELEEEVA